MFTSIKKLLTGITLVGGLLAYSGCSNIDGTSEPSEEQLDIIKRFIADDHYYTPGVANLIEKSNPLFDRHGAESEDNYDLIEAVYIMDSRLDVYLEHDKFRVYYGDDLPVGYPDRLRRAKAFFSEGGTPDYMWDDYTYIRIDKDSPFIGDWMSGTGPDILVHEAAHAWYYGGENGHSKDMREYLEDDRPSYSYWNDENFASTMIEEGDVSYLMSGLYSYVDNVVQWTAHKSSGLATSVEHDVERYEEGDDCIRTELTTPEEWIAWQNFNFLEENFGITFEENADALMYIYRDFVVEYRDELIEHDPNHEVFCWEF